ncbi:MAG: hypothetical protein EXR77_14435 [Myxococcales bacterium]|nr:hypothetical protein [Myxococcales bacterium]
MPDDHDNSAAAQPPLDLRARIALWTAQAAGPADAAGPNTVALPVAQPVVPRRPAESATAQSVASAGQAPAGSTLRASSGPKFLAGAAFADERGFDCAKGGNTDILVTRLAADGTLQPSEGDPDAPFGWFHGWRIIGGETRIDGGVYLGRKPREAIVVDMRRPGSLLRKVYDRWLERLQLDKTAEETREDLRRAIFSLVAEIVEEHMPYDEQVVKRLDKQGFLRPDEAIDLDVFLAAKGGVCRHQVCFVGAVLERLIDNGWLTGTVSLERKFVSGWFSHAWVRLQLGDGEIVVLDPAQRRYASLRSLDTGSRLLYGRSEDGEVLDSAA